MVESIKEHGVLNPVIVRKYNGAYEMLSGHNRHNAAKMAGIAQIPAIVKEHLIRLCHKGKRMRLLKSWRNCKV